ncbi:MAG: PQQ-dependent sugar dehydrogenase [Phycisphaerae bacterium]
MPHSIPFSLAAVAVLLPAAALFGADAHPEIVSSAKRIPPMETTGERGPGVPEFKIQAGYRVEAVTDEYRRTEVRFLQFDDFGTLYVSSHKYGTITSFKKQPDGTYKKVAVVVKVDPRKISGLHNMEFVDGWLWYTTSHGIYKAKPVEDGSKLTDTTVILPEGSVPGGGGHWWRPILVDSDGFYTGVGDHENFSDLNDKKILAKQQDSEPHAEEREKIWKYYFDGRPKTLFCSGVRNTEKLLFRPGTHEIWGCDQGSDNFGKLLGDQIGVDQPITDRIPGEEVNHYEQGKFYGHPYLLDANIVRPEYYDLGRIARDRIVANPQPPEYPNLEAMKAVAVQPAYMFPAHWAACGWTWLNKDSALGHRGDMYIGFHGSWNHDIKQGYCIGKLEFDAAGHPKQGYEIVDCLMNHNVARTDRGGFYGRPVDIIEEPGTDNLLFSVDEPNGRVYRLSKVAGK